MRILVVEDAQDIAQAISDYLQGRGIACDCAESIEDAEDHTSVQEFDCIILDLQLPDGSGLDFLKRLRAQKKRVSVIILTVNSDIESKLEGLYIGADDYIVKPVQMSELEARIRAVVRRAHGDVQEKISFGDLTLDPIEKVAFIRDETISFTRREYSILEILFRNRKKPVNKQRIFERVYAFSDDHVNMNAIELNIGRIRKKLANSNVTIRTLKGIGYQLDLRE